MTQPARPADPWLRKCICCKGERLTAPRIHNAMGRRDDQVGLAIRDPVHLVRRRYPVVFTWPIAAQGAPSSSIFLLSSSPNTPGCRSFAEAPTAMRKHITKRRPTER